MYIVVVVVLRNAESSGLAELHGGKRKNTIFHVPWESNTRLFVVHTHVVYCTAKKRFSIVVDTQLGGSDNFPFRENGRDFKKESRVD